MSNIGPTDLTGAEGEKAMKAAPENHPGAGAERTQGGDIEPEAQTPKPKEVGLNPDEEHRTKRKRSKKGQAVTGEQDTVYLSRAVYQSKKSKKSLTVHHIQRRLAELEYHEAAADLDGYYSDLTASAVEKFQREEHIRPQYAYGLMDYQTLEALFKNDDNVRVSRA